MEIRQLLEEKIALIMPDSEFSIIKNRRHGQSDTYTVLNLEEEPVCIAKFFDYLDGEDLKHSLGAEYINNCSNIDELIENIGCIEGIQDDIESIIERISLQKRCFTRYVDVCSREGLRSFPELLLHTEEVKIDNTFYGLLIEEFIVGNTLDKAFIGIETADINIIVDFFEQMGKIIKQMSDSGIVHRDISPDNIMYSDDKYILIDPGMVKIEDDSPTIQSTYLLGKKFYASPEQFVGRAKNATFSSDIYALGIIALELILKKNPLKEIILKGAPFGKLPHVELLDRYDRYIEDLFYDNLEENEYSAILFVIIKKMIQVEPRLRYDTIDSFNMSIKALRERMVEE